jgi:hypothetical protein
MTKPKLVTKFLLLFAKSRRARKCPGVKKQNKEKTPTTFRGRGFKL